MRKFFVLSCLQVINLKKKNMFFWFQDGEVLYHKLQSKTDAEKKAIR